MMHKEFPVNMNRDFKGIWLPREIWLADGLSANEKVLWAEINSLYSAEKGGCYASNDYLMQFMGVKERRLQELISNLKAYGLITQVSFDGRERVLKAITPPDGFIACRAEVHYNAPLGCNKVHPSSAEKCTPHIYRDTSIVTSIDTPPIPPQKKDAAKAADEILKDSSIAKNKRVRKSSEFSSTVREIAEKMVNALHEANSDWLIPKNLHSMMTQIEEMIVEEKREPKKILDVFMWGISDNFWMNKFCKPNPAKYLREQFGQISGQMKAKPYKNPNEIDRRLRDQDGNVIDEYKDFLF